MNLARLNPFPNDPDRAELWDMVVRRDIEAFLAQDWETVKDDYIAQGFFGIDGRTLTRIDAWRMTFPDLQSYKRLWLKETGDYARRFRRTTLRQGLYKAVKLHDIEITGDTALLHRKFAGWLTCADGHRVRVSEQSLYVCRKVKGRWKVAGFTGYLPNVPLEDGVGPTAPRNRLSGGVWPYVNSLSDVAALKKLLAELEQSRRRRGDAEEREWLDRACALLGEELADHLDYTALAARLNVSYEVFRHRFRRLTGMSPHRYRQSRVIERACHLLCTTRWTIAEVAAELNFCDEFHFSRSFKKITGQSPTAYRRKVLARR